MGIIDSIGRAAYRLAKPAIQRAVVEDLSGASGTGERQNQSVNDVLATIIEQAQGAHSSRSLPDSEAEKYFYGWQYNASTLLAESVMMAEWYVETRSGEGGEWEQDEEAELAQLLRHGNPMMSGRMLIYCTVLELAMIGKSFWHVVENSLNEPAELWPILGRMEPKGTGSDLQGWTEKRMTKHGEKTTDYERDEIVFIRWPEPKKPLDGVGHYQGAAGAIKMESQTTDSQWYAMKQGIWPSAILKLVGMTPEERSEARREFGEKFGGVKQHGGVVSIPGVDKDAAYGADIEWPPNKPRDMHYEKADRQARDRILAAHRTPAALMGLDEDVNRASAEALQNIFARFGVMPKLVLLADQVNRQLGDVHYEGNQRMGYVDPVEPNEEEQRNRDEMELKNGATTINEYRQDRGLEPVEWGDRPWLRKSMIQVGSSDGAEEPGEQSLVRQQTSEIDRLAAVDAMQLQMGLEADYKVEARAHFDEILEDLLDAINAADPEVRQALPRKIQADPRQYVNKVLRTEELARRLKERLHGINKRGLLLGGEWERGRAPNPAAYAWSADTPEFGEYLARWNTSYYATIAETTKTKFTGLIADAVADNQTFGEMRLSIVQEFGAMKESRATSIAMTESTKVFSAGSQAFRDSAGVELKKWAATFVNTRDSHAAAHRRYQADPIPNNEDFQVGTDSMPYPGGGSQAKENINCSCVAIAAWEQQTGGDDGT